MSKNSDKRVSIVERNTNETKITVKLDLDGQGQSNINTGLPFFDHIRRMIHQKLSHLDLQLDLHKSKEHQ